MLQQKLLALLVLSASVAIGGCVTGKARSKLTGEPVVYAVDRSTGQILDLDVWPSADAAVDPSITPAANADVIMLTLNSLYLKYLADLGSPHVLVYTEVYDDGTDDPTTATTKVLIDLRDQPIGTRPGVLDRVIYGPVKFTGHPLRVRLFVVELDKEDKEQTSKFLKAAGTLSRYAPAEAALPVGVAIEIAEALNQLNEDDYELRLDLTLHPSAASTGAYQTGPDATGAEVVLPYSREGRKYTLNAPLRTGSYLVLKREIPGRPQAGTGPQATNATLAFDASQPVHLRRYKGTDDHVYRTEELWRVQGGFLYRVTASLKRAAYSITEGHKGGKAVTREVPETDVPSARVVLQTGPNAGQEFVLDKGTRQAFTDQTYALLTLTVGSPVELTAEQVRAGAERDAKTIQSLLLNPTQARQDFGTTLENVTATVATLFQQRQLLQVINNKVTSDPTLRTRPEYVELWVSQLVVTKDAAWTETQLRNAIARNSASLAALRELVVDLPLLRAEDFQALKAWQSDLKTRGVEAVSGVPGRFRLKPAGQ
jgi:hypothetical protein